MTIHPVAVSFGIPIAAEAIESGLQLAQQSFHKIFASIGETEQPISESAGIAGSLSSSAEQLEKIAQDVRNWLRQQGVQLPYSITVSRSDSARPQVEIEGSEREKISELLDSNPSLLDPLSERLKSPGWMTPFGTSALKAVFTETSSHIE